MIRFVILVLTAGLLAANCNSLLAQETPHEPSSMESKDGQSALNVVKDSPSEARYKLDASKSTFMVRAFSGGLLWFKGHDHFIAVRDFTGEVKLTPRSILPASLQMTIKSDSLVETRDVFTEPQKQIINQEIQEIVLHTAQYPEITFHSTNVTGKLIGAGQFEARIEGDLTMHGVTRRIAIPAQVTLGANDLRARGEFTVDRSDFKVNATSAFHGLVRVRNKLKFTFDILASSY
ncbi:MAG: YceI family protein [Pyrinomonadaceae bacterium]|nr:YceI family protein [Pyrinomonadaceae bacterium]